MKRISYTILALLFAVLIFLPMPAQAWPQQMCKESADIVLVYAEYRDQGNSKSDALSLLYSADVDEKFKYLSLIAIDYVYAPAMYEYSPQELATNGYRACLKL